jgi:hypothetical protein
MDKQIKQEGGAGLPSKKEKGCQEGGKGLPEKSEQQEEEGHQITELDTNFTSKISATR